MLFFYSDSNSDPNSIGITYVQGAPKNNISVFTEALK